MSDRDVEAGHGAGPERYQAQDVRRSSGDNYRPSSPGSHEGTAGQNGQAYEVHRSSGGNYYRTPSLGFHDTRTGPKDQPPEVYRSSGDNYRPASPGSQDARRGSNHQTQEVKRISGDNYRPVSPGSHDPRRGSNNHASVESTRGRREPGGQTPSQLRRETARSRSSPPIWTRAQARNVLLNPNNPGHWAINYHLSNLVFELRRPKWHPIRRAVNAVTSFLKGQKVDNYTPMDTERRFRISFAEVQRMKVRKLQCRVVDDVVYMRAYGREPDGWEENLDKYVKALQDYDYMESRAQSNRDPFIATGEYAADEYVLSTYLPKELHQQDFKQVESVYDWEHKSKGDTGICGTRDENLSKMWFVNLKRRAAIAAIGGMFLVGPMWLMVLRNDLYTQLASTTAFVAVFGLIMAIFLDKDDAVLGSTAAYAAVLVVFVGTSVGGDGNTAGTAPS